MPSVFTLEAPAGFGEPVISQDYLELLGDPTLGHDTSLGHAAQVFGDAGFNDATDFFASKGLILGGLMAFGTAVAVGFVIGNATMYGVKSWRRSR